MDTVRAPNYELAKKDYMKGSKYKEIALKYNVTINTVKSWKQRYDWDRKGMHTNENVCIQNKAGAPKGNKNAVGNDGGAPPENKNAEKYGFFSKFLPEETKEIFDAITDADPLDLLWHQIQIAYAAIVRAQRISYVKDQSDMSKTKIQHKDGDTVTEERWEVQFAWDKQANFMKAQARAQGELRSMIKQYDEMLHNNWDLATEEQRKRIELLRAQTDKLTGNNQEIEDTSDVDGDIYGN